jgi:hypothetical protein
MLSLLGLDKTGLSPIHMPSPNKGNRVEKKKSKEGKLLLNKRKRS